ncbi:cytochrome c-type biogenesis protein CcmH [Alicyclobacillus sp.]|uniref:cytochrome c-type biogenesis protein n=1 Tax=Alicyclobacillus sp. TaxID=61169 RepID=UPI0025C3B01D|nr:cytochrome c-type biogenesis protein CcmH [Alicyclobacillus sp.]MCL6515811.1 cytochrome c-type biogenesis protein CcmH [Alicyclobacillus sp.]
MNRRRMSAVGLLCAAAVAAMGWWVWTRAHRPVGIQQQVLAIAAELRVPGEQDTITAAASTDPAALHMRYEIQQALLAGRTKAEILSQMESEYGPDVLAAPRFAGLGALVWGVPLIALSGLAALFALVAGRRTPASAVDSVNAAQPGARCVHDDLRDEADAADCGRFARASGEDRPDEGTPKVSPDLPGRLRDYL